MSQNESKPSEWDLKQERIEKKLAAAPIVEIVGVASPSTAVGWAQENEMWELSAELSAWRIADGEIREREVQVRKIVSHPELHRLMDSFKPYEVVRLKGRVVDDEDGSRIRLEEFLGHGIDRQLTEFARKLQEPVTFAAPGLGTFTLDRRYDEYTAEIFWDGCPIRLTVACEKGKDIESSLEVARRLWNDESNWSRRINEYAVQELLPLKNDCWLDVDEVELTAEEFLNRMTLEAICIDTEGGFTFWHDDGDLFFGHSIEIRGNLTDGPNRADIPG